MIKRQTINDAYVRTIDWFQNELVDWNSAGTLYSIDGTKKQLQKYHFGFVCDGSITSANGEYVFIYQKLGTKGLLLKDGEIIREINRSYYQSGVYEFPAAFITYNEKVYLVHCPFEYCRLEFEDVETGEIITNIPNRKPKDIFHSRLEISLDNKHIISKGWVWQPFDILELFNIEKCFENPHLLDDGISLPNVSTEICSAGFIDNSNILVCASNEESSDDEDEEPVPEKHIAIWNFNTNKISKAVKINALYGNIFPIDNKFCWDLYQYPKIIDFTTGNVVDKIEEIFSGYQKSSIIDYLEKKIKIAFNRNTKQIAIVDENKIEVLSI